MSRLVIRRSAALLLVASVIVASCGIVRSQDEVSLESTSVVDDNCAHVVAADIEPTGATHRVSATVRSADTGWDKYADAWEVRTPSGDVLATRILAHPHHDEQPFTRSLDGVVVPGGVTKVVIAARDSVAGFCGDTVTVEVSAE